MAASSILLPSFSAQTLASKPQTPSSGLPTFSSSSTSITTTCSITRMVSFAPRSSFPSLRKGLSFGSGFVPKVTLSSDLEQEEDVELSEGEAAADFSPDMKLFVGNLPFSVDSAELAGLFQRVGNVEMVEVIYDKQTGKSRGFGFVTMSSIEEAEAAAQQFNGYTLDGRMLRVNSGPPPPRRDEAPSRGFRSGGGGGNMDTGNRVYVGNLSWGVDNLALETLFSEQGKVLEAKVVYDRESGRSRGFGFVTYSSAEEVDNAISSLNGTDLDGRSIRVTVAEPRPRRQF